MLQDGRACLVAAQVLERRLLFEDSIAYNHLCSHQPRQGLRTAPLHQQAYHHDGQLKHSD
jgi:hypothetical protein